MTDLSHQARVPMPSRIVPLPDMLRYLADFEVTEYKVDLDALRGRLTRTNASMISRGSDEDNLLNQEREDPFYIGSYN